MTNSSFTDFVSFAAIFNKTHTKHQLYMNINNNTFSSLLSPQKYFIELHRNAMAGTPNDNRYSEIWTNLPPFFGGCVLAVFRPRCYDYC